MARCVCTSPYHGDGSRRGALSPLASSQTRAISLPTGQHEVKALLQRFTNPRRSPLSPCVPSRYLASSSRLLQWACPSVSKRERTNERDSTWTKYPSEKCSQQSPFHFLPRPLHASLVQFVQHVFQALTLLPPSVDGPPRLGANLLQSVGLFPGPLTVAQCGPAEIGAVCAREISPTFLRIHYRTKRLRTGG
jgi:hypothetical protein